MPLIVTLRSICVLPSSRVSSGEKAETMATRDLESAGPAVSARAASGKAIVAARRQDDSKRRQRRTIVPSQDLSRARRARDGGYWGAAGPPARAPQAAWKSLPEVVARTTPLR